MENSPQIEIWDYRAGFELCNCGRRCRNGRLSTGADKFWAWGSGGIEGRHELTWSTPDDRKLLLRWGWRWGGSASTHILWGGLSPNRRRSGHRLRRRSAAA